MGRPPIGKRAMTDAERMARYRERHNVGFKSRIDAVLAKGEQRRDFIHTAIERELKRRERAR